MVLLITGASGFVGRRLIGALKDRRKVRPVVRTLTSGLPQSVLVPDIGPNTDWSSALEDCSTVVHLAAQMPSASASASDFDRVNHFGTENLIKQAQEAGVKRFIFLSSIAAVAGAVDGYVSDERHNVATTAYGRSKRAAELAVSGFIGSSISLRPPLVIGSGAKGNWSALTTLAGLSVPLPFAWANQERSFMSIDNLIDALMVLIERAEPFGPLRPYAIADPDPISLAELVSGLRRAKGKQPMLLPVPVSIMEKVAKLAGKKTLADSLFGRLVVDGKRFNQDFGWTPPVSTRETISRLVN